MDTSKPDAEAMLRSEQRRQVWEHLQQVRSLVAKGEKLLVQQRKTVNDLARKKRDTAKAIELLIALGQALETALADRDRVLPHLLRLSTDDSQSPPKVPS